MLNENTTDLRIVRTLESINDAFIELMRKKRFEVITVKDITAKAKINRGTFYAHYTDKFDLMKKCQERIIANFSSFIKQGMNDFINENKQTAPLDLLKMIFDYINKNAFLIKILLDNDYDLTFQGNLINKILSATASNDQLKKRRKLLVPHDYLMSYIAGAHMSVIRKWLQNDRKETPKEIAHILTTISLNGPLFAGGLKS